MNFWGIKKGIHRRQSDFLFSKLVRAKRNYTCEKCGKRHEPNSMNLGVSHYKQRSREVVRYSRENVDVACNLPCHREWEDSPKSYDAWKEKKLGKKEYNLLLLRAEQRGHHDRFIEKELCKQFRKELSAL